MAGKAIVIGGGIIGLSSAYYLQRAGWQVTVLDRGNRDTNCSQGNAGYFSPSHFVPLAAPGVVGQGLRWLFNARSPFYVQPRLSSALIEWGLQFMRSANRHHVERSAAPLRDISLLSKACYESWKNDDGFDFFYRSEGMIEVFQDKKEVPHAQAMVDKSLALGLETEYLTQEQLRTVEPEAEIHAEGGIWFKCDAHCHPGEVMRQLEQHLLKSGAQILDGHEIKGFTKNKSRITQVHSSLASFDADLVVVATGAWSRDLATQLDLRLPLAAGRGYSFTVDAKPYPLKRPVVLLEGRVAITPLNGQIRFGGTMEITSTTTPPRYKRVEGIVQAVNSFFPHWKLPNPSPSEIWYGYRPCSADGLPYLGRLKQTSNAIIATGHAMLGLSLGAGTGKLVAEIAGEQTPSVDLQAFDPERFG